MLFIGKYYVSMIGQPKKLSLIGLREASTEDNINSIFELSRPL